MSTTVRLLAVIVLSVLLHTALYHDPIAQRVLDIGPPSPTDCVLRMGVVVLPVAMIELAKLVRR